MPEISTFIIKVSRSELTHYDIIVWCCSSQVVINDRFWNLFGRVALGVGVAVAVTGLAPVAAAADTAAPPIATGAVAIREAVEEAREQIL